MKLYSQYPYASMSMHDDPRLAHSLRTLIGARDIRVAVESGTFLGTGSTRLLAEAFLATRVPDDFTTFEINQRNWLMARQNLARYPFVRPVWGCTVRLQEALDWIRSDECITRHQNHPDIFIDDLTDPVSFYSREVQGTLDFFAGLGNLDVSGRQASSDWQGEGLLEAWLGRYRDRTPLVVLDSAGGTGYLEFRTVRRVMEGAAYALLLDDTHHLKHFRSLRDLEADPRCTVIDRNPQHGWVLAVCAG